jgi:ParB family chromosome partitioning protein
MSDAALTRRLAIVPLALVDDPALPARETMDDEKFAELVASIRAHGIIQPLALKPVGARYEVIAGHRRRLASLAAELTHVPAIIVDGDAADAEAIKLHENTKREDLNAAEEALWFQQLLDKLAGGDTNTLATLLGESRQYVESRLLLLRHDEWVFDALKTRQINFAVAAELNRFTDLGARRSHLEAAMKGGATARLVREWRLAYERLVGVRKELDGSAGDHVGGVEQPAGSVLSCLFCASSADPYAMTLVYMHRHCLQILERTLNVQLAGIFAAPAAPASTPATSGEPS